MTSRDALERPDALARDGRAQGARDQLRGAMELPGMDGAGPGGARQAIAHRRAPRQGAAPCCSPAPTLRTQPTAKRQRTQSEPAFHRGAARRGSWRPHAAPAPTPTPPLAPLALGATCSDAQLAPWKAGRKSPSTGAQWADDRSAVFLPLVFDAVFGFGAPARWVSARLVYSRSWELHSYAYGQL